MKKVKIDFKLSAEDVEAIRASLPLVLCFRADTDEQQMLNASFISSAGAKLSCGLTDFSADEFRVIYASVCLAKDRIAGNIDIDIDSEDKAELKKHLFTYIKLEKAFSPVFDALCK